MRTTSRFSDYKEISIKYTSTGFTIVCGLIGAVMVLLPVHIFFKIGFLVFISMALVFFVNPLFAMMIFLFIRPSIEPLINIQIVPGIPIVGFFALWITIFLVFEFLRNRTYNLKIPNIGLLWLLLPFSIFSMFNSVNMIVSFAHLLRVIGWISIYVLIFNLVKTRDDTKKVIIVLILSSVIPLIVGYYQLFTHTGMIDRLRGINRITSVFAGQPDTCAVFFSMIFFITLFLFTQAKVLLMRIILLIAKILILILIIFTYHRGSWIGLLMGMVIISFFHKKILKYIIPLFLLITVLFPAQITQRITEIFMPPTKYVTSALSTRVDLWKTSLFQAIPQHPFFGCGIGGADEAIRKYFILKAIPHNDYLRLAVEIGILGALLYVTFLVLEIRYYLKKIITNTNRELNVIVLGLLIYFIITSFAQNNFYNVNNMAIVFSMLAVSKKMNLYADRQRDEQK